MDVGWLCTLRGLGKGRVEGTEAGWVLRGGGGGVEGGGEGGQVRKQGGEKVKETHLRAAAVDICVAVYMCAFFGRCGR